MMRHAVKCWVPAMSETLPFGGSPAVLFLVSCSSLHSCPIPDVLGKQFPGHFMRKLVRGSLLLRRKANPLMDGWGYKKNKCSLNADKNLLLCCVCQVAWILHSGNKTHIFFLSLPAAPEVFADKCLSHGSNALSLGNISQGTEEWFSEYLPSWWFSIMYLTLEKIFLKFIYTYMHTYF